MAEMFSPMKRLLLISTICFLTFGARAADRPVLKVFIVSKDAGPGLHAVDYPAFPKLGYIGEKPDLTISELEGISYGSLPGLPNPDGEYEKPREDRRALDIRFTAKDSATLTKLTSEHIGSRILLMLDNDPLVAPEIKTPMVGKSMYISRVPKGLNTEELKSKLEKIVQTPGPTRL
jgi:hypothetical protein